MPISRRRTEPLIDRHDLALDPDLVDLPLLRDVIEQGQRAQRACVQDQTLAGETGNRIGQHRASDTVFDGHAANAGSRRAGQAGSADFSEFLLGFMQALTLLQQAGALVDQSDPRLIRLQRTSEDRDRFVRAVI